MEVGLRCTSELSPAPSALASGGATGHSHCSRERDRSAAPAASRSADGIRYSIVPKGL